MNNPEHPHHNPDHHMDESSTMKLFSGLILALLTFLLVIICVFSVRMITREAAPDGPGDPTDPSLQDPVTDPSDTPVTPPNQPKDPQNSQDPQVPDTPTDPVAPKSYVMSKTAQTEQIMKYSSQTQTGVYSEQAVLVNLDNNTVVAELVGDTTRVFPASMTKVMTLLVACENLTEAQYNEYLVMPQDIIHEMQMQNASGFGFQAGEELKVDDLLYAIALESDCAASVLIAEYVAGSHEAFVAMMNAKCEELGLIQTHFTNATGLHSDDHYTTCREMASIMAAAVDNAKVLSLLSEDIYVSNTNIHGRVTFQNTFFVDVMQMANAIPNTPSKGRIVAAKTGSTDEGGSCLVSYMVTSTGEHYVAVTTNAVHSLAYVYDYMYIYDTFVH